MRADVERAWRTDWLAGCTCGRQGDRKDGGAAEYRQGLAAVGRTVFQAAENTNSLMSNYDPLTPNHLTPLLSLMTVSFSISESWPTFRPPPDDRAVIHKNHVIHYGEYTASLPDGKEQNQKKSVTPLTASGLPDKVHAYEFMEVQRVPSEPPLCCRAGYARSYRIMAARGGLLKESAKHAISISGQDPPLQRRRVFHLSET